MVSIITMAANALGGLLVGALEAFFSLISWFLKRFWRALKLLFCVLPVTATIFSALFLVNILLLVAGPQSLPESGYLPSEGVEEANLLLSKSSFTTSKMYSDLVSWWNETVYVLKGSVAYIFLLVLTVLMFLPVVSVLLCLSVLLSFGIILFFAVIADGALYVIRALLGKSFVRQIQGRYFLLFKEAGKKHNEKTYEKWLRRHHDEFEDDEYQRAPVKNSKDSFYDDNYDNYEDDDYEDEYYEDDDYEDDGYEDEYYENDEYPPEEYDEYDEDELIEDDEYEEEYEEEDDYDNDKSQSPPPVNNSGFDFFAGCNSKESLDKKYKTLVKLYHPDNMDGDTSALQEINVQYDKAKKSGRFN